MNRAGFACVWLLALLWLVGAACGGAGTHDRQAPIVDDDNDDGGVPDDDDDNDDDNDDDDDDDNNDDTADDDDDDNDDNDDDNNDTADDDDDDNNDDNNDTADDDDDDDDDDDNNDDNNDNDDSFAACEDYGSPQAVGNLGTDELTEASGLAVSLKNPGVLWAHNDSGDGPYVYAMKLNGEYLGVVTLDGATAIDWEDMAVGPCGDDECLYLGDIGDNGASRTNCGVYRVVEPEIDPETPFGELLLTGWEHFPFSYPGGPRDAEALAVHPDGTVYIFAKYPAGTSEMYAFPELTPDDPVELAYVGDLDTGGALALTTGADIHRSGLRLLLRTYVSALEWRLAEGDPFEDILTAPRFNVPFGLELQGEAIAYDPADGNYLHVSEGQGAVIYRIGCESIQ